jgi:hypothetical protein
LISAGQSRRLGERFLLPILSILVIFCPSLAGVASAGVSTGTSRGPSGGLIWAQAINPLTPTTLYAGTGDGGVFKSTDPGDNLGPSCEACPVRAECLCFKTVSRKDEPEA